MLVIAELRRMAIGFAEAAGAAEQDIAIDFMVEARYLHQVWEIDVAIDPKEILAPDGGRRLEAQFHRAHEHIFAFADPASLVEVIAWRVAVRCKAATHGELRLEHLAEEAPPDRRRRAYFPRGGWREVDVLRFQDLEFDTQMAGPAIVESPFTSIVVDPDKEFRRSVNGNLIVEPGARTIASMPDRIAARA